MMFSQRSDVKNTLKILIDAHMVGEKETGNERYILGLLEGLKAIGDGVEVVVATSDPDALRAAFPFELPWKLVRVSHSPISRLFFELPRLAAKEGADLVHVTYNGPLRCPCPMVVTIHDVSYLRYPEWFSLRDRLVLRVGVGLTVARARGVIAISQHACDEIQAYYKVPKQRLQVTALAVNDVFNSTSPNPVAEEQGSPGIAKPYFLVVGNLQPRKNLLRLVEAFARLKRTLKIPHRLIVAGPAKWRESEVYSALTHHDLSADVVFSGYVSDSQLVSLYKGAEAFVYPSLYEGFGLPILEAMACGTPVITSSTSAMPETAGDAALKVNPYDVDDLAAAMARIVQSRELRDELSRQGRARARQFSWERTAIQTVAAYRRWRV